MFLKIVLSSSKAGSSADYIGEKGLGFKTTFRLSDDPHVFSNGFNFRLSSKGKIGYIVPYLVEDQALLRKVQQISGSTTDSPRTVIMLPLKVFFFFISFYVLTFSSPLMTFVKTSSTLPTVRWSFSF